MGKGDLDEEDDDMLDASLLAAFDWTPSSLADIHALPERTMWLYVSYRNGQQAAANFKGKDA